MLRIVANLVFVSVATSSPPPPPGPANIYRGEAEVG